jgi:hypothetical protein
MTTNTERRLHEATRVQQTLVHFKLLHADFRITQALVGHSFERIGLRRTTHITSEMVGHTCTTLGLSVGIVKAIKAIHPLLRRRVSSKTLRVKHVIAPEMVGCKWSEIGLSRHRTVLQSIVGLSLKELGLRPAEKAPIL